MVQGKQLFQLKQIQLKLINLSNWHLHLKYRNHLPVQQELNTKSKESQVSQNTQTKNLIGDILFFTMSIKEPKKHYVKKCKSKGKD